MADLRLHSALRRYSVAGFGVLVAAALWRNLPQLTPGAFNWAESGNVAAALVEGRGFSDPFGGGTGATAWIPPGYVGVLAGVFLLAGVKTGAAAAVVVGLAVLALAAAHAVLLAALPGDAPRMRRTTSVAFLAYATLVPLNPFEVMSEAWLNILLSALLLWAALEHHRAPRPRVTAVLVATAVLAPLTHAGLALATAAVLVLLWWRDVAARRPWAVWRGVILAGVGAALAVGGWTIRNVRALGQPVPLKSNLWFEVHLANVAAPDGLPRTETVLRHLPYFSTAEFERYAALGELRYVASFRAPAVAALRADPAHFAANVLRRVVNALALPRLADGSMAATPHYTPGDYARLVGAGELLPLGGGGVVSWMRMDTPPATQHAALAALRLDDFPHVWRDWMEARAQYSAKHWGLRGLAISLLIAGVPTLAWLVAALASRGRPPAATGWSALIFAAMLLPFVLVNHSIRHQQPLIAMQAVAIGAAVEAVVRRRRRPEVTP